MPKVVSPITVTVEFITAVKDGDYGPYRSVLFKDGEEKIWQSFKPDADELNYLTKGKRVQLVPATDKGGKVHYSIVLLDGPAATSRPQPQPTAPQALPPATGMSPEQKRAIAAYINEQVDMLAFCWETAHAKLPQGVSEESIRCAASTLYIAAQRKFHV